MPHIFVRNDTTEVLNIAISFGAPVAFTNSLAPGATWGPHNMSSFAYPSFEARLDHGPENNHFSAGASLAAAGTIAGACAAGAASVMVGAASVLGVFGGFAGMARAPAGVAAAGALMNRAHAGGAAYGRDAEGVVLRTGPIVIRFAEKHYTVRSVDGNYELFDEDEHRVL
ncbi:hypothetical protein GGX14DRAFT_553488 [Mycena pura]|uniref:Uncharacterized protein n=1 Tax=Mycena pura TaxID=153505 RepID=A0AAD6YUW3_9AGAR|nr:hypothetical protein GGX14DRAFT_553488 [Mycena pura]